jgi:hypothetical protein
MQQMWVQQAGGGLVAMNVGSLAVSVGSQLLIFAAIVGSCPNGIKLSPRQSQNCEVVEL